MTPELARSAVEDAVHRYCADRRARIPEFVDRHFSLRGAAALHRSALGWDILRMPFNLTMAVPAVGLHVAALGARRLGSERVARALTSRRLALPTSVAQRLEWLIQTELLELPCQVGNRIATRDALAEAILAEPAVLGALEEPLAAIDRAGGDPALRAQIERMLAEYAVTRGAAAEIATALTSLGAGALTLGKLTPGFVSFGPALASIAAQQTAIASFPMGTGLGSLWYGLFPASPAPLLAFGLSGGLLMVGAVLSAFAGIVTDPVQRRMGLHQRRLRRLIDAMERQMLDPTAPGYVVFDRYVARLIDVLDVVTAIYRMVR
jgi:uncharacterized protein DUF6635